MMGHKYICTVATFICMYSIFRTSNAISDDDLGAIQRLVALGNLENEAESPEANAPPYLGDPDRVFRPYSLVDLLNTRVNSERDLCSSESVRQFLSSGNLGILLKCKEELAQRRNITGSADEADSQQAATGPKVIESYSGKLLKRLFANGLSKFNRRNSRRQTFDEVDDDDVTGEDNPAKRSRLSINGALGSLVDMLHQETRPQRRPVYAFHRELLHLG